MRTAHAIVCACATLVASLPAQRVENLPAHARVLEFRPAKDRVLEVRYLNEKTWNVTPERSGTLTVELVIHWRFKPRGRHHYLASGTFEAIQYRGAGRWDKAQWTHDVAWSRKRGYRRGKGTEADKSWVTSSIRNGIRLTVDRRGACTSSLGPVTLGARQGLLASALLGFCAILPGTKAVAGDEWEWPGRHLDHEVPHMCDMTSTLDRFTSKSTRVEITSRVQQKRGPRRAKGSLVYAILDGLPRRSTFVQDNEDRKVRVQTRARWLRRDGSATETKKRK